MVLTMHKGWSAAHHGHALQLVDTPATEVALSGYRDIVRRWLVKTGGYECQVTDTTAVPASKPCMVTQCKAAWAACIRSNSISIVTFCYLQEAEGDFMLSFEQAENAVIFCLKAGTLLYWLLPYVNACTARG